MDKVHISDSGDNKGLVRGGGETLDNTGSKELFIGVCALANCCADDAEEPADKEDRTFAVFPRKGAVEWTTSEMDEKQLSQRVSDANATRRVCWGIRGRTHSHPRQEDCIPRLQRYQ